MKKEKYTCVICKKPKTGFGNNPDPVKKRGRCCDVCNADKVIPARLKAAGIKPKVEGKSIFARVKNPQLKASEVRQGSKIVYRGNYRGIKILVRKGGCSWCGYIGLPMKYKAPRDYDKVEGVNAHGGLTFSQRGTGKNGWMKGYHWYGWDYGHFGDYMHFSPELEGCTDRRTKKYKEMKKQLDATNKRLSVPVSLKGKDWSLWEVIIECYYVAIEFHANYIDAIKITKLLKGRKK